MSKVATAAPKYHGTLFGIGNDLIVYLHLLAWLICFPLNGALHAESLPAGMVASDNPDASQVGAALLRKGGDAVDAAVGTALALGVVHAFGSGLGGGGFAIVSRSDGETIALDFRETAPAAATQNMFIGPSGKVESEASTFGAKAVAVPGELAGLFALHQKYGKLPWAEVVQPAIDLARDGFVVSPIMHTKLKKSLYHLRASVLGPYLVDANEASRAVGMRMRLPPLAKTLETIAKTGSNDFYKGEIAKQIVQSIRSQGGLLTLKDLADYRVRFRPVLTASIHGYEVLTMPPPSSGGVVLLQILKVLDLATLKSLGHNSAAYIHLLTECMKHAFADRARAMGDPDFVAVPLSRFLGLDAIKRVRGKFDPKRTLPKGAYGSPVHSGKDDGTSHLNVMDANGNAVALTTTINTGFGSHFVAGKTGLVLNNQMDDFVAQPGVPNSFGLVGEKANAIEPNKRPLSSMSPTILRKDGRVMLIVGASGGPMIITSTLQVLLNMLIFEMSPSQAVVAPRIHHQWVPNVIKLEDGIPDSVQARLELFGHQLVSQIRYSATQVIYRSETGLRGAADPSKGGSAEGIP